MGANNVAHVLSNFGIVQSTGAEGKPVWTLEISLSPSSQPQTAYFDETLAKWRFDENVSDNDGLSKYESVDSQLTAHSEAQRSRPASHPDSINWTDALLPSEHTNFFRAIDWAATPLGSCETWPYALRLYTHMLFSDSRAAAIYWGAKRIAIYNENSAPLLGSLHPILMGRSFESVMPELWDYFRPIFHAVEIGQSGIARNGFEASLERHGYLEETWWDGGLVSLKADCGNYGGAYFSWVEVTRTVLRDRRTVLLNRLGQSSLIDGRHIWKHIYEVFADYPRDISMAIMYVAEDPEFNDRLLHLKHTIGIGSAYSAATETLDVASSGEESAFGPLLRRARDSAADFIVINTSNDEINPVLIENVEWQGYGQPSRHLVVIPLQAVNMTKGYIIIGLNPRRDFDADHEQFISDLARQLRELMARITTEEQSQRREQYLMKELSYSQRRINRIVELAPVGIYDLGSDGSLLWANSHFYDMLGTAHDRRDPSLFDWRDYILPEDQDQANVEMARSLIDKVEISDSLRLKRLWKPPTTAHDPQPGDEPFWILYSASPDIRPDGSVHSLMGCLTNISHLKWAEKLQAQNAEAARLEKQRQEEFIDITSHEMRNPLSAIMQCADSIIMSLYDMETKTEAKSLVEIVKHNVEAAESIHFCTAHQRRIIDDILTLGKLESGLLTITPVVFRPQSLLDEALQMFKADFESSGIEVRTSSYPESVLTCNSTVYADSVRLMQVLVNLLTNAIKFTRTEKTRNITIKFGSSYSAPTVGLFGPDFQWNTTRRLNSDLPQESRCGEDGTVYLYYAVIDSGKGIPGEYLNKLFTKFEQADRRTHIKYGGSGLGLFISRELAEMQGGRIGIESRDASGSTFAFYTKARLIEDKYSNLSKTKQLNNSTIKTTGTLESPTLESNMSSLAMSTTFRRFLASAANYNILLVEDNILNQKILAQQLRKAGCIVHVANHGGEAIDFVLKSLGQPAEYGTTLPQNAQFHIDCILMDWEMPVCDGLMATKRLREIESQQGITRNNIIGITANARAAQISRAMGAGMDKVISKPFRVSEIFPMIEELLGPKSPIS